jgi:hypothetical protein
VQVKVARHASNGESVIVIGHRNHPEVQGLLGCYDASIAPGIFVVETEAEARGIAIPSPERLGYVTQTTLSPDQTRRIIEILAERFPRLISPQAQDICYATQNRQSAVKILAKTCDLVLVIGAPHSSNSVRLCETVTAAGGAARLIETAGDIQPAWLAGCARMGLTASASAPEHVVQTVIARLQELSPGLRVCETGAPEKIIFRKPQALLELQARAKPKGDMILNPQKEIGMSKITSIVDQSEAGLSSVIQAAADLALKARELVEQAGTVAEKELSMVLRLAEEARDGVVSTHSLERARKIPLLHDLRHDAHRAVNLGFDAAAVAYMSGLDLLDGFVKSRPEAMAAV